MYQNPGVLVMASLFSHISPEVIDIARDPKITLLTLSPLCRQKLQLVDAGVFDPLKIFIKRSDEWHTVHHVDKLQLFRP